MKTTHLLIAAVLITTCIGMAAFGPALASLQRSSALDLEPIPLHPGTHTGWYSGTLQRCSLSAMSTNQIALDPIMDGSTIFADAALMDLTRELIVPAHLLTRYVPLKGPTAVLHC